MSYLLDSHVLLWWLEDSPRIGPAARNAIANPDARVLVSAASVWEIAIKQALGKLRLPSPWSTRCRRRGSRSWPYPEHMQRPPPDCRRYTETLSAGCWWLRPDWSI